MSYIYGLIDPITNTLKYVGKTENRINDRLSGHISCAKKAGKKNILYTWIFSLLKKNLRPKIYVIEECESFVLNQREIYWINYYKTNNFNLKNSQPGGGGQPKGYVFKKRYVPPKGQIPKHLQATAGKSFGKRSTESKLKMSKAQKGRISKLRKKLICKNIHNNVEICFYSVKDCAKYFKCTLGQISQRCLGKVFSPLNHSYIFKWTNGEYNNFKLGQGISKSVYIYENNLIILKFNSIIEAANHFSLNRTSVMYRCEKNMIINNQKWTYYGN